MDAKQKMDSPVVCPNGRTAAMGCDLLVTDNLDVTTVGAQVDSIVNDRVRYPMRLSSTCIIIVVEGTVRLNANFRELVVSGGSCVIARDGTIIEGVTLEQESRLILMMFSRDVIFGPLEQHGLNRLETMQVALLQLQPQYMAMIKTAYHMLFTILSDPSFESNRKATTGACLGLIEGIIMQASDNRSESLTKVSRQDEIVARFVQCVADNYRSHRELGFYADQLGLSLKYMSHVVYGQSGRHPSQWIKDYVILDAKTMLRSGRYSVQQVAEELNFPNQSFFGKYFKEAVGISPKKWIKQDDR